MILYFYDEITKIANIKNGENEQAFDYNAMGHRILDAIKELSSESRDPIFTWLSHKDKAEPKMNLI